MSTRDSRAGSSRMSASADLLIAISRTCTASQPSFCKITAAIILGKLHLVRVCRPDLQDAPHSDPHPTDAGLPAYLAGLNAIRSDGGLRCVESLSPSKIVFTRQASANSGPSCRTPAFGADGVGEIAHAYPKSIRNVVPLPFSLSTAMRPLWSLTTDCTIARPSPVPCVWPRRRA